MQLRDKKSSTRASVAGEEINGLSAIDVKKMGDFDEQF